MSIVGAPKAMPCAANQGLPWSTRIEPRRPSIGNIDNMVDRID
jgi:hypothetical protein